MFCSNCGKEINNSANFCKYCGCKLMDEPRDCQQDNSEQISSAPPIVKALSPDNTSASKGEDVKPKKKKHIVMVVILILVLSGAVCSLLYTGFTFGEISFVGLKESNTVYNIGETITTNDFSFTVNEFLFVDSVKSGTLEHDNIPATGPNAQGNTIAWFNFTIDNYGDETINLFFNPLKLVVEDSVFDDSNAVIQQYCIEMDDASTEVAPYALRHYNYAIFNVPAGVLGNGETYAEIELYGRTYKIKLAQ